MVDKTVTISEAPKNLLRPYTASGTDSGTVVALGNVRGLGTDSSVTSTDYAYIGSKSIKVTCQGAGTEGFFDNNWNSSMKVTGKPGVQYTFSVYIKSLDGVQLKMGAYFRQFRGLNVINTSTSFSSAITPTSEWVRYSSTFTMPLGYDCIEVSVSTLGGTATTFYIDCLQLEEGSTATVWEYPSVGTVYETSKATLKTTIQDVGFTPRNLLPANVADGTDTLQTTSGYGALNSATLTSDTADFYKGSRSLKVTITTGLTSEQGVYYYAKVEGGKTYTFAIRAKMPVNALMCVSLQSGGQSNYNRFTADGTWQWVYVTFTVPVGSTTLACYLMTQANTSQAISFNTDCWMLEEGNTPSDWQPGNMLTYNQQSMEIDVSGYYSTGSNCTTTLTRDTTQYVTGTASAKATINTATSTSRYFNITVTPSINFKGGKTYLFLAKMKYIRNNHSDSNISFYLQTYFDGSSKFSLQLTAKDDWTPFVLKFTPAVDASLTVYGVANGTGIAVGDALYMDDVWVIEYPTDNLNVKASISLEEKQGNLAHPNVATGSNVMGTVTGLGSSNGVNSNVSTTTEEAWMGTRSFKLSMINPVATSA
jgi:hypothetical protein